MRARLDDLDDEAGRLHPGREPLLPNRRLGMVRLHVTTLYHSGKFLLPRNAAAKLLPSGPHGNVLRALRPCGRETL